MKMHTAFVRDPRPPEAVWSCRCEHEPRQREKCSEVTVVLLGTGTGVPRTPGCLCHYVFRGLATESLIKKLRLGNDTSPSAVVVVVKAGRAVGMRGRGQSRAPECHELRFLPC